MVKTKSGFIILKLIQYTAPKAASYEQVKEKVREALVRQQAEEQFADLRDKLSDLAYEHPDSLSFIVKDLGLPIKETPFFSRNGASKLKTDLSSYLNVREVAFSNDVLHLHNNSDVLQLDPDTAVVIRVKSYLPATFYPFDAVQAQIMEKLKADQIQEKTKQLAENIMQSLQAGSALTDKVLKQYHLNWVEPGFVGRHTPNVDPSILEHAFSMPKPEKEKGRPSIAIVHLAKAYAVIQLDAYQDGSLDSANKQAYSVFAEQIQGSEGLLEYELYKDSLLTRAKIKKQG